jgi:hypothetical protein
VFQLVNALFDFISDFSDIDAFSSGAHDNAIATTAAAKITFVLW